MIYNSINTSCHSLIIILLKNTTLLNILTIIPCDILEVIKLFLIQLNKNSFLLIFSVLIHLITNQYLIEVFFFLHLLHLLFNFIEQFYLILLFKNFKKILMIVLFKAPIWFIFLFRIQYLNFIIMVNYLIILFTSFWHS